MKQTRTIKPAAVSLSKRKQTKMKLAVRKAMQKRLEDLAAGKSDDS